MYSLDNSYLNYKININIKIKKTNELRRTSYGISNIK